MAHKRKRNVDSDGTSDDAALGQLSAAAAALTLPEAHWTQFTMRVDDIVQGVTDFCQSQGLFCKARVRSSDKSRATVACKQQASGCPLRLTIKKTSVLENHGRANMHSFLLGTCSRVASPAIAAVSSVTTSAVASLTTSAVVPNSKCTVCKDDDDPVVICCAKGAHHFCSDCLTNATQSQLGDLDAFIQRRMQLLCPYDGSVLHAETVADVLLAHKVKAPAQSGPGIPGEVVSAHDHALASIRHIILPRCPQCDIPIADFEACAALTCGSRMQFGDRIAYTGGCGAQFCAWCLVQVPPHESAHDHVRKCHKNPNPDGSLYPPQPHPAIWKSFMTEQARERVFNLVEVIKGSENREALYTAVRLEFPELQLSEEWLAKRHRWLILMLEMTEGMMDIHRAQTCLKKLVDKMGFTDCDALRRAIILCNYDIQVICDAMQAHIRFQRNVNVID